MVGSVGSIASILSDTSKEKVWCAGLVMTLDDEGKLQLSYMGTDPSMDAVDIKQSVEVDYAALDSEYRELAGRIKAVGVTPVTPAAEDQLIITAQVLCPLS